MLALKALLVAAPMALAHVAFAQCDLMRLGGNMSMHGTHIDSHEDGSSSQLSYAHSDGNRCSSANINGRLRYSENEDDVVDVPDGARAVFRERTPDDDRELTITRGQAGDVMRLYRRNGASADYDNDARRWLAGFLPAVLMEANINVAPRVARWRAQGGVDNVLAHIGTMSSSGAKRSHYQELMKGERLSNADLDKVVRHAGRNIPSSGDLRAVLERAAPLQGGGTRSASALEEAAMHIASSGDRTSVLEHYGRTSDREMLLSVMRVARTIQSSGDKSNLLRQLAPNYLAGNDRDLYSAFYQTAITVQSSGDLRNVLDSAMPYVGKSPEQALMVLDASRSIGSSGDRSEVLISLVNTGVVNSTRVRDAFFQAAESVSSSGDRSRVLEAAGRRP